MAGKNVTIGNVNIAMSANAAKLIQQTEQAQKSFKKSLGKMMKDIRSFNSKVGTMAGSLKNLMGSMTRLGLVGSGTAAALGTLGYKLYENQREMQRMATTAGVTLETYAKLTHATNTLGLENEYLADALKDLNVRIVDAASGGGALVDFFLSIGESAKDWMALDPTEQFTRFQETISRLDPSTAKFWADEVNDSMYRLSTTMTRSGKTLGDFMAEAEGLGAGTSGQLIHMVNDMYASFHRLKIIISEVANTTLAIFSKAFTSIFDKATEKFRGMISEGETAGEVIFNFSKQIALGILRVIQTASVQIEKFMYKVMMQLGKFDSSFLDGLSDNALMELIKVESKISDIQRKIEAGKKSSGFHAGAMYGLEIPRLQKQLGELLKLKEELNKEVSGGFLQQLIDGVDAVKYDPKKLEVVKTMEGQADTQLIINDRIREGSQLIKDYLAAQGLSEDSALRQLQLEKAKVAEAKKYYESLPVTEGNKAALTKQINDANKTLKILSDLEAKERKRIAQEQAERDQREADEKLRKEKEHLDARLQMAKDFYRNSAQEAKINAQIQDLEYKEMLKNKYITEAEYAQLSKDLTLTRIHDEIALEMMKYGTAIDGMKTFFNNSKSMAKAAFILTKSAALSQTLIAQYQAVSNAWADPSLPWYAKAGQAILAAGQVGAAIQGIQSVQGQFHNGGQIPRDGTYYMEGGEIVIPKDKVGEYIDAVDRQASMGSGGGTVINSTINMGANLVDEKVMAQALAKQQSTIAALVQREERKRPTRSRSR